MAIIDAQATWQGDHNQLRLIDPLPNQLNSGTYYVVIDPFNRAIKTSYSNNVLKPIVPDTFPPLEEGETYSVSIGSENELRENILFDIRLDI